MDSFEWNKIAGGVLATALFFGDCMITPAISVLSAVEGLKLATPVFEPFVLPITLGLGIDLKAGDVAARANFCTLDAKGIVTDRRAGRIDTPICEAQVEMLKKKIKFLKFSTGQ